eukprot:3909254-Rhodomonas_salina.1
MYPSQYHNHSRFDDFLVRIYPSPFLVHIASTTIAAAPTRSSFLSTTQPRRTIAISVPDFAQHTRRRIGCATRSGELLSPLLESRPRPAYAMSVPDFA